MGTAVQLKTSGSGSSLRRGFRLEVSLNVDFTEPSLLRDSEVASESAKEDMDDMDEADE